MTRCALGERKLRKYSRFFNKNFTAGLVRGGTNHRVDLRDENGVTWSYYPETNELVRDDEIKIIIS